MGLDKYIKLTAAARLCGLDKRTLLARLEEKGLAVPLNRRRPILVREADVDELLRDFAMQPRLAGGVPGQAPPLGASEGTGKEE